MIRFGPSRRIALVQHLSTHIPQPVVEWREYALIPQYAVSYMQVTSEAAELRRKLSPLRFFSLPDTGGMLHMATHCYYYPGGLSQREEIRGVMAADTDWKKYLLSCRPFVQAQSSFIFVEAPLVAEINRIQGLRQIPTADQLPGTNPILEIRRYKLKLGYDTVPSFLKHYSRGLPSKLSADGADPTTSLVTVLYAEAGRLNEVIEIWRHGNGPAAMEQSRVAARGAQEWRKAIADMAELSIEFSSTIHKPVPFSPLK